MTAGIILGLTVVAFLGAWVWHKLAHFWLAQLAWRWFSGMPLDGKHRTDARWLHKSSKTHHPTEVVRWHHWPRLYRAAVRTGATVAAPMLAVEYIQHRAATEETGAALALAAVLVTGWWLHRRQTVYHLRHWWQVVRPVRTAAAGILDGAPPRVAIKADNSWAKIYLPPGFIGTDREWEMLKLAVTTRKVIEAPDVHKQLEGAKPYVLYTQSAPPPPSATWDDVAAMVEAAADDEVILGLGRKRATVGGSLSSDSPHVGFNTGSGGGKTNLGSFCALQFLHRGDIAVIIDAKLISYPWARGLPNVSYAGTIPEIHDRLCWLGRELRRRNEVSLAGLQPSGAIYANVGARILIFAEELNYVIPQLKRYWADLRAADKDLPKRSPALDAIADIAFAGRQVRMHIFFIGQMLTADATGAKDSSVRGNIGIVCMARYTPQSWSKMSALPMPPVPTVPGRIQVVTAAGIRETQVPYLRLDHADEAVASAAARWARDYAVSGKNFTPLPAGMPGAVPFPGVPSRPQVGQGASDMPFHLGSPMPPLRPPDTVTLRELVTAGMFRSIDAARKASQRDGFPAPVGRDGAAHLYDVGAIYAHRADKAKVTR